MMRTNAFLLGLLRSAAVLSLLFSCLASAGSLSISSEPLGTGTGITVKPNLWFILDDSGSMANEYLPDNVGEDEICHDANGNGTKDRCLAIDTSVVPAVAYDPPRGDPPYAAPAFNKQWYNPAIRYRPPLNADGSSFPNASTTTPLMDPFDATNGATIDLSRFPDVVWCRNASDSPTSANCVKITDGQGYIYPDATYRFRKGTASTQAGAPYYYAMAGTVAWCTSLTDTTTCQATKDKNHRLANFDAVTVAPSAGSNATTTLTISATTRDGTMTALAVNGVSPNVSLIGASVSSTGTNADARNDFADALVAEINRGTHGYLAARTGTASGNSPAVVTITSPTKDTIYNNVYGLAATTSGITISPAPPKFGGGSVPRQGVTSAGATFTRVEIRSGQTYAKADARTDCAGSVCTYAEELQNFANWYSYYRKRMLMAKTALSHAFSGISDASPGVGFRVGLTTINRAATLAISDFDASQKASFYATLFARTSSGGTPLRGALSRAGQMYGGRIEGLDPLELSCQQNFTFLATDGFWTTEGETGSYGPKKLDNSENVGDQDGAGTARPYLDGFGKSDTLADVAMYYYKNDLRSDMANDVPTSTRDAADWQHMVTFTMGLGLSGTLAYSPAYESSGSTDFNKILNGTLTWPDPIVNTQEERLDDLWHAAVNGRGKYFAAADPNSVAFGVNEALTSVTARAGAGAAAATSSLQPTPGDNFIFLASYETQSWVGQVKAFTINLTTGEADVQQWEAQSQIDSSGAANSRTLYKFDGSIVGDDKKEALTWANLSGSEQAYFNPSQLSQCVADPGGLCPSATGENLLNYLKGGADTSGGKYRVRGHVLGDIVHSQPVYVNKSPFNYSDADYSTYKATAKTPMVYVGGNDGFLHALRTSDGVESWAYAPSASLPNMHKLADTGYQHRYFVDGQITAGDVFASGAWKTMIVSGMNYGGKMYFGMDVTAPATPKALWEFTDACMGYSYGNPILTKLANGTWVALVTSGYNNTGTGCGAREGQGVLYVLNAYTGAEIRRIYTCTDQSDTSTCEGSSASPVGLAKINAWIDNPLVNNTARFVYGTDLDGNVWRFDINLGTAFKLADLNEPITTKVELAEIGGKRVVYVASGLFLQSTDKNDTTRRAIYAIKDTDALTGAYTNIKSDNSFVERELVNAVVGGAEQSNAFQIEDQASLVGTAFDWDTKSGWWLEFSQNGERVNVDPKIQLGTLEVITNVPDASGVNSCVVGGTSFVYHLDLTNGLYVQDNISNPDHIVGAKVANALAVGSNVIKLTNGKVVSLVRTADDKLKPVSFPAAAGSSPVRRVSWRELLAE